MVMAYYKKSNMSTGQVSPQAFGLTGTELYQYGFQTIYNCYITPTGGVRKRPGTRYIAPIYAGLKGRIAALGNYVVVFHGEFLSFYLNGKPLIYDDKATVTPNANLVGGTIAGANKWDIFRNKHSYIIFDDSNKEYNPQKYSRDKQTTYNHLQGLTGEIFPQKPTEVERIFKKEADAIPYTYTVQKSYQTFGVIHSHWYGDEHGWTTHYYNQPMQGTVKIDPRKLQSFVFNKKLYMYTSQGADLLMQVLEIGDQARMPSLTAARGHTYQYGFNANEAYSFAGEGIKEGGSVKLTSSKQTTTAPIINSISPINSVFQQRAVFVINDNQLLFSAIGDPLSLTVPTTGAKADSPINLELKQVNQITSAGGLDNNFFVASSTEFYVLSSNTSFLSALEPWSLRKIADFGAAAIAPVIMHNALFFVSNDNNHLIRCSYNPQQGILVENITPVSDVFREQGGILEIEVMSWRHPYILALTGNGAIVITQVDTNTISPCPWIFPEAEIKDFCITRQAGYDDMLWILTERGGTEFLELLAPPIDGFSPDFLYRNPIGTEVAKQKNLKYFYNYRSDWINVNAYCDFSVHTRFGNERLRYRFDGVDNLVCSSPIFDESYEIYGGIIHHGVVYTCSKFVDAQTLKVYIDPQNKIVDRMPHYWEAEGTGAMPFKRKLTDLEHLRLAKLATLATTVTTPNDDGAQPPATTLHYFEHHDQTEKEFVKIDGTAITETKLSEFNIGIPYRAFLRTTPLSAATDRKPHQNYGIGGVNYQTLNSGVFYTGTEPWSTYPVSFERYEFVQYAYGSNYGNGATGQRLVILSEDPVEMHILSIEFKLKGEERGGL